MVFRYSYTLPGLCFVWFAATFIITYVIAICNKDVEPVFPYISDTGTWSPESCIFGLMLNTGAIIQGLVAYIRYRQLRDVSESKSQDPPISKWNFVGLVLGLLASFGVCVVGNFQETNVLIAHLVGAFLAFGLGSVYLCIQTYLSFKIYPTFGNKKVNFGRLGLSVIGSIAMTATGVFGLISFLEFTGDDITKWTKDDGGYTTHFVSTVSEWVLAIATLMFLATFTSEFKQISFNEPMISVIP